MNNLKLFIAFVLLSNNVIAADLPELPKANELLSKPIALREKCSKIVIREWRGGSEYSKIERLNYLCNLAANNFTRYVISKGYKPNNNIPEWNISLLSLDENSVEYRSLNDNTNRFINRPKYCNDSGRICLAGEKALPLSGWTQWNINYLFVRNDIFVGGRVNYNFDYFFVHELFHVWSKTTTVYDQEKNRSYTDEILAKEFAIQILN